MESPEYCQNLSDDPPTYAEYLRSLDVEYLRSLGSDRDISTGGELESVICDGE